MDIAAIPNEPSVLAQRETPTQDVREGFTERQRTASAQVRAVRMPFVQRRWRLIAMLLTGLAGGAAGAFLAQTCTAEQLSSALLTDMSGSFLDMFLRRLLWGAAFLFAEYICGYFAFGGWLVWIAPAMCGLGCGLSAAALLSTESAAASVLLMLSAVASMVIVALGSEYSGKLSLDLLQLISGKRSSIIMSTPMAGAYTLRFGVLFAALCMCALYEATVKINL